MILNFLLLITPLHAAVLNKDPIITQLLVSSQGKTDIDINAKNGNGVFFYMFAYWTPLHIACFNNDVDIVKILLSCDLIDISAVNNDFLVWLFYREFLSSFFVYKTPLDLASKDEIKNLFAQK